MRKGISIILGFMFALHISAQISIGKQLEVIFNEAKHCYLIDDYKQLKECISRYEDLFNLNNKVEITIDVDLSEMQKIQDDNVYGGDYDSIIGMQVQTALPRFLQGRENAPRLEPAEVSGTFCGVLVESDSLGNAKKIRPLIFGTHLIEQIPTDF